jgi:hypothetical protein
MLVASILYLRYNDCVCFERTHQLVVALADNVARALALGADDLFPASPAASSILDCPAALGTPGIQPTRCPLFAHTIIPV